MERTFKDGERIFAQVGDQSGPALFGHVKISPDGAMLFIFSDHLPEETDPDAAEHNRQAIPHIHARKIPEHLGVLVYVTPGTGPSPNFDVRKNKIESFIAENS